MLATSKSMKLELAAILVSTVNISFETQLAYTDEFHLPDIDPKSLSTLGLV